MSAFADELLSTLSEHEAGARAQAAREAEEREARRERFDEARHAAWLLFEDVCRPLVEDFQGVMSARKILREGRVRREFPAVYRAEAAAVHLVFRALGAARTRRYYEVRLTANVGAGEQPGSIELSAQCLHYLPPDSRRAVPAEPPQALAELPRETVSAAWNDPAAAAAARDWCQEVLKRSAAAVIDAAIAHAQPFAAFAPVGAVPAAADIDVPASM